MQRYPIDQARAHLWVGGRIGTFIITVLFLAQHPIAECFGVFVVVACKRIDERARILGYREVAAIHCASRYVSSALLFGSRSHPLPSGGRAECRPRSPVEVSD
jgi:hypothetical protein